MGAIALAVVEALQAALSPLYSRWEAAVVRRSRKNKSDMPWKRKCRDGFLLYKPLPGPTASGFTKDFAVIREISVPAENEKIRRTPEGDEKRAQ